jgi:hypothetical protein
MTASLKRQLSTICERIFLSLARLVGNLLFRMFFMRVSPHETTSISNSRSTGLDTRRCSLLGPLCVKIKFALRYYRRSKVYQLIQALTLAQFVLFKFDHLLVPALIVLFPSLLLRFPLLRLKVDKDLESETVVFVVAETKPIVD